MTKEENLFRIFILSLLLHLIFLFAISIPLKKQGKRIDIPFYYSVSLVPSVGSVTSPQEKAGKEIEGTFPSEKEKSVKGKYRAPKKEVLKKVIEEKSISKKKINLRSTTKEELTSLEEKIRELKAKTRYFDVGKGRTLTDKKDSGLAGLPGQGTTTYTSLDPATSAYVFQVWSKVKKAWAVPSGLTMRSDLETIVVVRIRKDGRIVDIEVEKRSGNRMYDESVLRTLRSADPFPSFPEGISGDYLEIGFRFLPGELS